MKVAVKLFARARDLAQTDRVDLDLPDNGCVADVRASLMQHCPALAPLAPSLLIALGTDYANDATLLHDGVEVACFPPVSGG